MERNVFLMIFMKKLKMVLKRYQNGTKMITTCGIRRAGVVMIPDNLSRPDVITILDVTTRLGVITKNAD